MASPRVAGDAIFHETKRRRTVVLASRVVRPLAMPRHPACCCRGLGSGGVRMIASPPVHITIRW